MFFVFFTILPFTACLFWTVVLLLDWRRDNAAQHVLAAFMGASAMLYLCHALFFNREAAWARVSESVYAFCNIAVFPLYYLYISRLTNIGGLSRRHLTVLLPAVAIGLWAVALQLFCPGDAAAEGVRVTVMRVVFMLQLVPICWVCYRRLRKFDREIANYYADTEKRSVRPTERMTMILVAGAFISGISNLIGRDFFASSDKLIYVPSLLFTALLFGVGYVGKRQEFCIDNLVHDEKEEPEEQERISPEEAFVPAGPSDIVLRLGALMADRQLFLQPDLRLSDVATMLRVGRTTLSQRINQELGLSFSDYVGKMRVEYACRLLEKNSADKLSLTVIAEMSGFSSDSSFYRAFRRHTGKTPKQFL